MNWFPYARKAARLLATIGVGKIIANIVKQSTPITATYFDRVAIEFGSFVIAGMLAQSGRTYIDNLIDQVTVIDAKQEPADSHE